MRVLVNATTLVVGGGIQVGVSFVEIAIKRSDIDFLFLISKGIYDNLSQEIRNDDKIICFNASPATLIRGISIRSQIKKIEQQFSPDLVYSIGFPSYVSFRSIEIGRYTNPWEINPDPLPWDTIYPFYLRMKMKLGINYRIYWARKANFIETQTNEAMSGIAHKIFYPIESIKVIPNSPNSIFLEEGEKISANGLFELKKNKILCLSAAYPHKNLLIIPKVASILKIHYNFTAEFILTIPFESSVWRDISNESKNLGVSAEIRNLGPLKLRECLDCYRDSKIVFLPTLLEIFSATYLEAMAMKVPILTSDLNFAHDNCGEGAIYFNPRNPIEAADKIILLCNNEEIYQTQIKKGLKQLLRYPSIEKKFDMIFNWFHEIKKYKQK